MEVNKNIKKIFFAQPIIFQATADLHFKFCTKTNRAPKNIAWIYKKNP
jgi:hypothetical protein